MSCLKSAVLIGVCIAFPAPLCAAAMAIEGDKPRERITVTITNAGMDEVLKDFGRRYGFDVKGLHNEGGDPFSGTLSGSLENILGRLLRNRNYMIVRSPDNHSGIEKLILIDEASGAAPASVTRKPARRPATISDPSRVSAREE